MSVRPSRPPRLWSGHYRGTSVPRVTRVVIVRCRRGVAAVEFAIVALIFITLLAAAFDIGGWVWQRMQMHAALAAGAHYAQSFPTRTADIKGIIAGALPVGWTDVTIDDPVLTCDCGGGASAAACGVPCPPGTRQVFVTLSVTHRFSPLRFITPSDAPERYVVRVQ